MTKTYPPRIQAIRQHLLDAIEKKKARYMAIVNPDPSEATALAMSSAPKTATAIRILHDEYLATIRRDIDHLAKLEGFATLHMKIDG